MDANEVLQRVEPFLWEADYTPGDMWIPDADAGPDPVAWAWKRATSGRAMLAVLEPLAHLQHTHAVGYVITLGRASDDWRHPRPEVAPTLDVYDARDPRNITYYTPPSDEALANLVRTLWPVVTIGDVHEERHKRFAPGVPPPQRATFHADGTMTLPGAG